VETSILVQKKFHQKNKNSHFNHRNAPREGTGRSCFGTGENTESRSWSPLGWATSRLQFQFTFSVTVVGSSAESLAMLALLGSNNDTSEVFRLRLLTLPNEVRSYFCAEQRPLLFRTDTFFLSSAQILTHKYSHTNTHTLSKRMSGLTFLCSSKNAGT
jgi:hypothetical protein